MLTTKDIEFVKHQSQFHARQAIRFSEDPVRGKRHSQYRDEFEDLANRIEQSLTDLNKLNQLAAPKPIDGHLRLGNLDALPEHIRNQIKISESDQLESDIVNIINNLGGEAAIDEIFVALWKKNQKTDDRNFIARKLYRMARSKIIVSTGRKGYFSTVVDETSQEIDDKDQVALV